MHVNTSASMVYELSTCHSTINITTMQQLQILKFQFGAQVLEQLRKGMTAAAGKGAMSSTVLATSN